MKWEDWKPNTRDLILDRLRRGEITPEIAEQEAQSLGLEPFETKPDPCEFDPDSMHWWSVPMALAWIAWRNTASVREHCAEYREARLIFVSVAMNIPINGGTEFQRVDGHELKPLGPSTIARLSLDETYLQSTKNLPLTTRMTIARAEKQLIAHLAAGSIVAIAKDASGLPVDVPGREWPYLEFFVERQSDVLKRGALEFVPAFTDIKLPAEILKTIWPEFTVEAPMIEPMTRASQAGYVPLCSAIHWVMTESGRLKRHLEDTQAWNAAVRTLTPLMATGEVEVIGRDSTGQPQPIDPHLFADVPVGHPLRECFSLLSRDGPWISCTPYVDDEHWGRDFNDLMYLKKASPPAWTHLQVKKSDILRHLHFLNTVLTDSADKATRPSKSKPPTLQQQIRKAVNELWPKGDLPRVLDRDKALAQWFKAKAQTPPSPRTIRRALN
uniref:hypothetical protein n=1 Tax=Bradyrhizobium sp. (strain ORS 278) TaxID=114615 RepID=UPI0002E4A08F|nr:hypothetical protein [Bradyrhizobium sp. ORS 278]